ncbi:MAG TPA: short-chain dehydrogenase, partial [Thermoanaerobaculia bacterium]
MNIENRKILVLGGYGLVGTAVCRELLARRPREIQIHSLRIEESQRAVDELKAEAGATKLSTSAGNIFGLLQEGSKRDLIRAELRRLDDEALDTFVLYDVLHHSRPDIVVDCVNTSTGIAYGDIFRSAEEVLRQLEAGDIQETATERLLDALYMPRLIRHIQIMYRGMIDAGTGVYVKIGTTGTGGMGLNIPYT